ncbi:hypothetical protein H671_3g9888 [Cricetulus griseus]|nr:hypothetical protein H671_3g9888 [Cricetulus griseus]
MSVLFPTAGQPGVNAFALTVPDRKHKCTAQRNENLGLNVLQDTCWKRPHCVHIDNVHPRQETELLPKGHAIWYFIPSVLLLLEGQLCLRVNIYVAALIVQDYIFLLLSLPLSPHWSPVGLTQNHGALTSNSSGALASLQGWVFIVVCPSRNMVSVNHHSSGCHDRGHRFKGLNAREFPEGHIDIGMS